MLGVSPDSIVSHQKFISKKELPFNLIADTEKEILKMYNVWGERKMYGRTYMGVFRTTFLIDENGILIHIIDEVNLNTHPMDIIKIFEQAETGVKS